MQTLDSVQLHLTPLEMCTHVQPGQRTRMRWEVVQGSSAAALLGQLSLWLLEQLAHETCEAHSALALNPVLALNSSGTPVPSGTHSTI